MRMGNARYGLWIVIVCQLQKSHFRHVVEGNCVFSLFFCVWDENCENPFHSREQELVRQSALCARKPGLSSISCLEEDTHHFKIAMVFADLSSVMRHRMALLSVFSRIHSEWIHHSHNRTRRIRVSVCRVAYSLSWCYCVGGSSFGNSGFGTNNTNQGGNNPRGTFKPFAPTTVFAF